jgi:hypothetical protein
MICRFEFDCRLFSGPIAHPDGTSIFCAVGFLSEAVGTQRAMLVLFASLALSTENTAVNRHPC